MTRLACDRCRQLESKGELPTWALEWWTSHKRRDEERVASEARAKKEAAVRKKALAKLTQEERDELGV